MFSRFLRFVIFAPYNRFVITGRVVKDYVVLFFFRPFDLKLIRVCHDCKRVFDFPNLLRQFYLPNKFFEQCYKCTRVWVETVADNYWKTKLEMSIDSITILMLINCIRKLKCKIIMNTHERNNSAIRILPF